MKIRIKVKDGRYYPQYRRFGIWWGLRRYACGGLYYIDYYVTLQDAKDRIDRFLETKPGVIYIEYP